MKVGELIKVLSNLDPDLEVLVRGYEGGYSVVRCVTDPAEFVRDHYDTSWMGAHERLEYVQAFSEGPQEFDTFNGVFLY